MTLPNFLIIGAQKSGTTTLFQYLNQHPEICMSTVKEPCFLALENDPLDYHGPRDQPWFREVAVLRLEDYQALFGDCAETRAAGEGSTLYLFHPSAPAAIHSRIPDARLIAMLRNPVDRTYSAFLHRVRTGREPFADFKLALEDEARRIEEKWEPFWHYKRNGLYALHLSRYLEYFPMNQMRIYLYDDFERDPQQVVADALEFLGVDPSVPIDTTKRYNESYVPRLRLLHRYVLARQSPVSVVLRPLLPDIVKAKVAGPLQELNASKSIPKMSSEIRRELVEYFRADVLQLQQMLDRDLSFWLE